MTVVLDTAPEHVAYALLGCFIIFFGLVSLFVKEKLFISEACKSFFFFCLVPLVLIRLTESGREHVLQEREARVQWLVVPQGTKHGLRPGLAGREPNSPVLLLLPSLSSFIFLFSAPQPDLAQPPLILLTLVPLALAHASFVSLLLFFCFLFSWFR